MQCVAQVMYGSIRMVWQAKPKHPYWCAGNSACPPAAGPKGPFFYPHTSTYTCAYWPFRSDLTRLNPPTIDLPSNLNNGRKSQIFHCYKIEVNMEKEWLYIDKIDSLPATDYVHCDTRDFHILCVNDSDGSTEWAPVVPVIGEYSVSSHPVITVSVG